MPIGPPGTTGGEVRSDEAALPGPDNSNESEALASGPLLAFADWPHAEPTKGPGIYTIWRGPQFLYVGVAGRGVPSSTARGLWGRLNSHASGRRSGDQFCIYVCDRLVLPTAVDRLEEIVQGKLSLDALTRQFIRAELGFRFLTTPDYASAIGLENRIKFQGLVDVGRPLLNPGAAPD